MNPKTLPTSAWILSMAVVALLNTSVVAQVPELGYVVSSHRISSDPGVGGLVIAAWVAGATLILRVIINLEN